MMGLPTKSTLLPVVELLKLYREKITLNTLSLAVAEAVPVVRPGSAPYTAAPRQFPPAFLPLPIPAAAPPPPPPPPMDDYEAMLAAALEAADADVGPADILHAPGSFSPNGGGGEALAAAAPLPAANGLHAPMDTGGDGCGQQQGETLEGAAAAAKAPAL
jgi:hypothetical protein